MRENLNDDEMEQVKKDNNKRRKKKLDYLDYNGKEQLRKYEKKKKFMRYNLNDEEKEKETN